MIVTIDGPAGAGKSFAARALADRLGVDFLDTGAMYRAVTLAAMQRGIAWDDADGLLAMIDRIAIQLHGNTVLIDDIDVSNEIRTAEVTANIHYVADAPAIRERLVQMQRNIGAAGDYVTEGRDQGSVVFPNADCKIYLTATIDERARRRLKDFEDRGTDVDFQQVAEDIRVRDHRDENRSVGPLVKPANAIEVITDDMSKAEVVEHLERLVQSACSGHDEANTDDCST